MFTGRVSRPEYREIASTEKRGLEPQETGHDQRKSQVGPEIGSRVGRSQRVGVRLPFGPLPLTKDKQVKSCKPRRRVPVNPTNVLATGLHEKDNMRVGVTVAPRKVIATERKSIARTFAAPRFDMGEYSPTSTIVNELVKLGVDDLSYHTKG